MLLLVVGAGLLSQQNVANMKWKAVNSQSLFYMAAVQRLSSKQWRAELPHSQRFLGDKVRLREMCPRRALSCSRTKKRETTQRRTIVM